MGSDTRLPNAASRSAPAYRGDDKLVFGIVLAVVTFWLFAQTTLNVAPAMRPGADRPERR